jgi:hypothetical protein
MSAREEIEKSRAKAIGFARDEMRRVLRSAEAAIAKLEESVSLGRRGDLTEAYDRANTQMQQAQTQSARAVLYLGIAEGYRDAIREMDEADE